MRTLLIVSWLLGGTFLAWAKPPDQMAKPRREFSYGTQTVGKTTFSHDGRLVIVSSNRSRIGVFHGRTALLVNEFKKHKQVITALAAWPEHDTIVSADASGLLMSWRPRTGQLVSQVRMSGPVRMIRPQPNGPLMAVLSGLGVWLVDVATGAKQLLPASELKQVPTTLQFDATGHQLAIGFADGSVAIRNLKTSRMYTTTLFKTPIRDVLFRGDSLLVVAGTPAIGLWHFSTADPARLVAVSHPVWCIAQRTGPSPATYLGFTTGEVIQYTFAGQQEKTIGQTKALVQNLFVNSRERLLLASYRKASPKTWLLE